MEWDLRLSSRVNQRRCRLPLGKSEKRKPRRRLESKVLVECGLRVPSNRYNTRHENYAEH